MGRVVKLLVEKPDSPMGPANLMGRGPRARVVDSADLMDRVSLMVRVGMTGAAKPESLMVHAPKATVADFASPMGRVLRAKAVDPANLMDRVSLMVRVETTPAANLDHLMVHANRMGHAPKVTVVDSANLTAPGLRARDFANRMDRASRMDRVEMTRAAKPESLMVHVNPMGRDLRARDPVGLMDRVNLMDRASPMGRAGMTQAAKPGSLMDPASLMGHDLKARAVDSASLTVRGGMMPVEMRENRMGHASPMVRARRARAGVFASPTVRVNPVRRGRVRSGRSALPTTTSLPAARVAKQATRSAPERLQETIDRAGRAN
jgi:hypothetical protein